VRLRCPGATVDLARQVAAVVERLRDMNLYKPPGIAETIDWATSLAALGVAKIDESVVDATLGAVLKYREDHQRVRDAGVDDLVRHAIGRALSAS
jgi:uncharacterized protein with von Willebrand factor type A (vWA) domain